MIRLKDLLEGFKPKIKQTRPGAYRVSLPKSDEYGFVEKRGREWYADIRRKGVGPQRSNVIRRAGIHKNLKAAIEELMFLTEDLLLEQNEELRNVAMEFLRAVKQKVGSKKPDGFGGFEVAWAQRSYGPKTDGEIMIMFDTPREVRHPDEYFDTRGGMAPLPPHVDKKMGQWNTLDDIVWKVVQQFQKKYKKIEVGAGGEWSGPGVRTSGRPRMSRF